MPLPDLTTYQDPEALTPPDWWDPYLEEEAAEFEADLRMDAAREERL